MFSGKLSKNFQQNYVEVDRLEVIANWSMSIYKTISEDNGNNNEDICAFNCKYIENDCYSFILSDNTCYFANSNHSSQNDFGNFDNGRVYFEKGE